MIPDFDPKRQIAIIWSVEDVLGLRPDLTEEQAMEVLERVKHKHDAIYGVNWDTLSVVADIFYPEEKSQTSMAENNCQIDQVNKLIRKDKFVVCMDSSYVRDSQMFDMTGLSQDEFNQIDLFGEENENRWHDMEPTPFIAVVDAETEHEACNIAATQYRYDVRCLFTQKISTEK